MGKTKSFADKMNKSVRNSNTHCPVCGESFTSVKMVTSEKSEKTNAWRFNQSFVRVCKCNESKIIS
jgi:C4-type Zn-finger protein